jgi:hypothetical protein
MSDGSIIFNSQAGQPNIYLYNNNNSGVPEPTSGQIRANNVDNRNVTQLFISHITSDGIDIDVFLQQITTISVIYLQDRNNSNNNVRFNVTGAIIDTPNNYVTVPVLFDIAQGSGTIDFGDGHPLFMSIFDNSQLIDSRISALEIKTQNQSATSSLTTFSAPISMNSHKITNLDTPINDTDAVNRLFVDNSISDLNVSQYTPLTQFNDLESIVITNSNDIAPIKSATQNITATASLTSFIDSTQLLLDTNQFFGIKSPNLLSNYMIVTPTTINTYNPINMDAKELLNVSGVKISGADTSNYFIKSDGSVDTNTYLKSADLSALETKTQHITANISNTIFNKTIFHRLGVTDALRIVSSEVGEPFILDVSRTIINAYKQLHMQNQPVTNALGYAITSGLSTQFLKGNGTVDSNTYLTATSITGKLNIDGSNSMTGALNMNNQAINNSGIVSAVGFVKNGGLSSEFLKANGSSDPRTLSGLQVIQSNFQVGANGITTEVNLTASPDIGSYTWTDISVGFTRRWKFYAISTRGNGNTAYTMRFKSSLGNMFEWVLPNLPQSITNQPIEITMTVTRRLPTSLVFYGKWDCSSTGSNQGFWTATVSTTNVPSLANGSVYNVSIQSNNANANITFQYIEVQNVYTG